MEYRHLTPDAQERILAQALLAAEQDHFVHTLNVAAALAAGNEQEAEQQQRWADAAEVRRDHAEAKHAEIAKSLPDPDPVELEERR